MDSSARREKILQILQESSSAVTGTALSKACNVSRQIVVGDVAILRAQGIAIISTPRGYQLVTPAAPGCTRVFVCCHGSDLMEAEPMPSSIMAASSTTSSSNTTSMATWKGP